MPYTVWSRGRMIGETDLGFCRSIEQWWSGWFHPNAEGERVMPLVASVLPAVRAYIRRDAAEAAGSGAALPELEGSTLFADLAESFQHLEALDLELRRDDGSVVPTSDIGIQDTHQLLALAREVEEDEEVLGAEEEEIHGEEDGWEEEDDFRTAWTPAELDETPFPRYQIHVQLLHRDVAP